MWMAGLGAATLGEAQTSVATSRAARATSAVESLGARVKDLEHQICRISLLNQALWELLRDRANLTDEDLERVANEIDLRDGQLDGRVAATAPPPECPSCHRVANKLRPYCLYCGKPVPKDPFAR